MPLVDLALLNKTSNTAPVKLNEIVQFNMEIYNQGNVAVNSIDLVNYIPSGFQFEQVLNPSWTLNGTKALLKLNEIILPGQSKTVSIALRLKSRDLTNLIDVAEIAAMYDASGVSLKDYDSTPDQIQGNDVGGVLYASTDNMILDDGSIDEDDQDPASIQLLDLALILTTTETKPVKRIRMFCFRLQYVIRRIHL